MKRLLVVLCLLCPLLALAEQTVTLGVFAFRPKPVMAKKYDELARYLSQSIPGYTFAIEYLDQHEIEQALSAGRLDFIFTNPSHFVRLRHANRLSGAMATLQAVENGIVTHSLGGVILARSDLPIRRLSDLKGRRIAIPGPKYLGGYQTQAYELLQAGIDLPDDATLIEAGSHDKAFTAVLNGQADVAFVRTGLLESLQREGRWPDQRVQVVNRQHYPDFPLITSTRLYPEWAFAALPSVPEDVVKQVNRALLLIEPDMPVARAASIHGFTIPADYQVVDQLARALRLPPYEQADFAFSDVLARYRWPLLFALLALLTIGVLFFRLAAARAALAGEARRLRDSEQRFHDIANASADWIWERDAAGRFVFVSDSIQHQLGYRPDELIGRTLFELMPAADVAGQRARIDALSAAGQPLRSLEYRILARDGEIRTVSASGLPIVDKQGQILGYRGVDRDITESRLADAELNRYRQHLESLVEERTNALSIAKEAAETASRAKSTFLANMSHELRTPLNAIMGMTAMALRRAEDRQQREQLTKVEKASSHLLAVISDILDLSRIEAERLTLEQTVFQPGQLVDNLLALVEQPARDKGLKLRIELPPEVASQPLLGDPLRLGQVLANLVGNAIKFTQQGEVCLQISSQEQSRESAPQQPPAKAPATLTLHFAIRDTGIGIPAEILPRLFMAFEQADNSMTRKYGGSGLGLAISQRLIRLMGGEISVSSVVGGGSCFAFTLPLPTTPHAAAGHTTTDLQAIEQLLQTRHPGAHILLVEDEPINREITLSLLEDCGLVVDVAEDGAQALQQARQSHYALILMDMQMPVMNGLEATAAIRQDSLNRATPILAMTANAFAEDRQACLNAGMTDFLSKPVRPEHLFATLLYWLDADPATASQTHSEPR